MREPLKQHAMFKTITHTAAVIAASATVASAAGNYISAFPPSQDVDTEAELGLIVVKSNGNVDILKSHNGRIGKLLSLEGVLAGGNSMVDVEIKASFGGTIAVLEFCSQVVDTQELNFNRHN